MTDVGRADRRLTGQVHLGQVASFAVVEGAGTVTDGHTVWPFHCTQLSSGARSIAVGTEVSFVVAAGLPGVWEAVELQARPGAFMCPVCASPVAGEEGTYEICGQCGWEDDPAQRDDTHSTGANQVTLTNARDERLRSLAEAESGAPQPDARG